MRATRGSTRSWRQAPGRSHTNATCPTVLCGEPAAVGKRSASRSALPARGGVGAQGERGRRPEPAIPAESAARVGNRNVFWCPRSTWWAALCRATTTCHQQWPIVGRLDRTNRVADSAVNMGVARSGQLSAISFQLAAGRTCRHEQPSAWHRAAHADANSRQHGTRVRLMRVAGFGRRERRRRRWGGNGGRQASAASHPSGSIAAC